MDGKNEIIDQMNPTSQAKAEKNPVEVENEKKAHIKDGVAVTRFIYWLKHQIGKEPVSEISAQEKLEVSERNRRDIWSPALAPFLLTAPMRPCALFGYRGEQHHVRAKELLSGRFRRSVL